MSEVAERQLRVLFYLYFPGGGIGRYTVRLMPELKKLGAHVEAAVVPEFEWLQELGFGCWPGLKSISHGNPLRRKFRFLVGQFINPRRLAGYVKESCPDVVHLGSINHLSYPSWERLFPADGPRLAVSVHDVRRQKGILCKPWEAWQLRRFYRRADLLFVHSERQRQELMEFARIGADGIHIVPHGPYEYPVAAVSRSETRQRLGVPDNASLGLCFGLVRDEKNIDRLIRAVAAQGEHVHLVVAGNSVSGHRPVDDYEELARREGVSHRVHFRRGYVPDAEVAELFEACDWAGLTYSCSFTSQSGVLSSAVHYRVPVLATPAPTFVETLSAWPIGLLCQDDSQAAVTEGVFRLTQPTSDQPVFEFERYLQDNSWAANAQATLDAYSCCLNGKMSSAVGPSDDRALWGEQH